MWRGLTGWFPSKNLDAAAAAMSLSAWLFARTTPAKSISKDTSYDEIDEYIEEQMHRLRLPAVSLAIVEGNQIVHLRGFGFARSGGEAPTPQTPFSIGSLTKSFTALAVMQLVEAGKIDLDSPVQRYLPWFKVADPQASARMTVRHLLNQTSGLPALLGMANLGDFDSRPQATERQVRSLSTLKLTRQVGLKFEYSNTNFNVLGLIIEAASGESYSDYIQQHIFEPLEMCHSYTSKLVAQQNSLAMGYRYWFGHPFPAPNLSIPTGSLPSGQLISSAEDMAHYLIANLNGGCRCGKQILSEAGMAELHRGTVEIKEMGASWGYYGMGWISQQIGESKIVSHSGIVPDFGAFMALVPEQKKGMVLLFNANHAMMKLAFDEFGMGAALRLAGEPSSPTRLGVALWLMRGILLLPVLQLAGVFATLRLLRRWRLEPALRPSGERVRRRHILLSIFPNLFAALTLVPVLGKMRGFMRLFMPDFSWMALICGSFAGIWAFVRTVLILWTLRKSPASNAQAENTK